MRDIVIDLGSAGHASAPDEVAPAPHRAWARPVLGLITVLLLVMTLVQSTSAQQDESPLVPLGQIELDFPAEGGIMFTSDGILAFHPEHGMAVYEFDGSLRWDVAMQGIQPYGEVTERVIYQRYEVDSDLDDSEVVEARDPITGEVVWQIDGYLTGFVDDLVITGGYDGDTPFQVHDMRTAELIWASPPLLAQYYDSGDMLFGLTHDHVLVKYDIRTGQLLQSAQLELPDAEHYDINQEPGAVVVHPISDGSITRTEDIRRYDRNTLQPLPKPATRPELDFQYQYPCGELTCVHEETAGVGTIRIADKQGATIRTLLDRQWLLATPAGLLVVADGAPPLTQELLDPHTGEPLPHHPGWQLLSNGWDIADGVLLGHPREPEQTYLALLDANGLQTLGTVPATVRECQYRAQKIACFTGPQRIHIWGLDKSLTR